jgi:hypothetical protein
MKIPYLNPERALRTMDTKYVDYESDLILDFGDTIKVEFPDGTILLLHAGWNHDKLRHAGVTIWEDPESNPVLTYTRSSANDAGIDDFLKRLADEEPGTWSTEGLDDGCFFCGAPDTTWRGGTPYKHKIVHESNCDWVVLRGKLGLPVPVTLTSSGHRHEVQ